MARFMYAAMVNGPGTLALFLVKTLSLVNLRACSSTPCEGCEGIYYFFNPGGRRKVSSIIIFLQNVTDFTAHPNLLAVIIGHAPLL